MRIVLVMGLFCALIFSSAGIVLADQNNGITISPVSDLKIGSSMTISGTYPESSTDTVVAVIIPKSYYDAQEAFFDETGGALNEILNCPDDTDYCTISRTNPDGTSLTVPFPNCPDFWSKDVPVVKGKEGVNTWECTFDGIIGERIMQPDTYVILAGGQSAGDLVEKTFKIIK